MELTLLTTGWRLVLLFTNDFSSEYLHVYYLYVYKAGRYVKLPLPTSL
jgi:hypothetical protein